MSILSYGETPQVNSWPPVHLFPLITTPFTCFASSLARWYVTYFIHFTIHFNRFVFSRPRRLKTFLLLGQSICLNVCRSAFDDGQALEIVVGYLTVDYKVLLVRFNLGSLLRENCRLLHPTLSLGVNTNVVANYATTQSGP